MTVGGGLRLVGGGPNFDGIGLNSVDRGTNAAGGRINMVGGGPYSVGGGHTLPAEAKFSLPNSTNLNLLIGGPNAIRGCQN